MIKQTEYKQVRNSGFTLIELVITITLISILFSVVAIFMSRPLQSYTDTVRRVALVDAAQLSLQRMGRDINNAIPNSVRVKTSGTLQALEFLNIVEGKRYRAQGPAGQALNFNAADTDFDVWGNFLYANLATTSYQVIIYNTGAINGSNFDSPIAGENVYSTANAPVGSVNPPTGSNVITPAGRTITLTNPTATTGHINISGGGWQFAFASPSQRVFLTDGPVSYICNPTTGSIMRYSGYPITSVQPTSFAGGVTSGQLTQYVSACTFTYTQGSSNRNGLAVLRITLAQSGETVTLVHQVAVDNAP